jgi:hypothetical protein
MRLTLAEQRAVDALAKALYDFLPGSGNKKWTNHVTFATVAGQAGVGEFWAAGSKQGAIATLLGGVFEHRRQRFEPLLIGIVREGVRYREKRGNPVSSDEIKVINGLLLDRRGPR